MSEAGRSSRGNDARVSLGVPELDEMLAGGLMPHRPYLVVGPSGTGKTTLALQFLCEGVRRGERVLYVTLEDPPNEVRWNHRSLRPELDSIDVFDAIPDVMRYERVPFKDIAAVRQVVPFGKVASRIRQTPEFTSVEVTGTALEQMLRSEVQKRGYTRLVIDSLTALQYFCMKGFDATVGAQTFLRFLTDLRTTTILTIEAPLEDVETPERMLARGEIQLFRWELDGATVRAVGVEKFRGSSHDVRLHPYRIGSKGLDVQLAQTISRDTRRIVEPALEAALREERPAAAAAPVAAPPPMAVAGAAEPLAQQIRDLVTLGVDLTPLRSEIEAAMDAARASRPAEVAARLARISALAISLVPVPAPPAAARPSLAGPTAEALQRAVDRADRSREGLPPTELPPSDVLARELGTILEMVPGATPSTGGGRTGPTPPAVRAARPVSTPVAAPPPPSAEGVARAAALLGEPTVAVPAPPEPASGTGRSLAGDPSSGRRTPPGVRARAAAPIPEPPPLPRVAPLPSPPAPAKEAAAPTAVPPPPATEPKATAPAEPTGAPVPVAVEPPMLVAPAPRRRRRAAAPKPSPTAVPAPTAGSTTEGVGPPAPAPKPRRRVVRRKKAPPVVAAAAENAPPEPASAAPAPAAPPTPEGPPPPEAS